jgi:hypothetical protein
MRFPALLALSLLLLVSTCKKADSPGAPLASGPCKSDDDCAFACERKGDCCHNPYCESPALASDARDAADYNRDHCTQADFEKCPRVGSRMELDYRLELHCRNATCVADKKPLATDGGTSKGKP